MQIESTMYKSFILSFFLLSYPLIAFGQILPADRQIDWSNAGLKDTTTSNFQIIDLTEFGINGDGITPNDDALTAALASPSTSGKILKFPTGVFLFNEPIILESNTILSGEGANNTSLSFDLGGSGNAINISGNQFPNDTSSVVSTGEKDDVFLEINNANSFQVGDWIRLQQRDTQLVTSTWAVGSVGQIAKIEDIIDNKIFLSSALRKSYSLADTPIISKIIPIENVGISCLKIIRIDDAAPAQTSNIRFDYAANCWVSSIESSHCTFSHIDARFSTNLKIEKSYFHDAFDFGGGGRAYGIMLHFTSNEILVENNIFKRLRHSMILQAGANGNVFAYNYSFDPFWTSFPSDAAGDMVLHGNYVFANLFEHNIVQNIVIDNSHGPNGPNNTFFRNRGERFGIFFSADNSPAQNFIANEVTNTNSPYSFVNYIIQGIDHFILGNNNKGVIDPPQQDTLSVQTIFYSDIPDFVPPNQWASIGIPNNLNQGEIPALLRIQDNDPFMNTCGEIPTNTEDLDFLKNSLAVFPNPFHNSFTLDFEMTQNKSVKIDLIDIYGKKMQTVIDKLLLAGNQRIHVETKQLVNGIYFLRLEIAEKTKLLRLIKQ